MTLLLSILANDILPILGVAAIGFLLARYLHADVKTISSLTFNALTPCLVFTTLVATKISAAEFGLTLLFGVCSILGIGLLARLATLPLRLDHALATGFVLAVMFANVGNYGLPLVSFAFGQAALAHATLYMILNLTLMYTVGVFLAARGRANLGQAATNVLQTPVIYGVLAAIVVIVAQISLPAPVMRPVELLSGAALPTQILVLGMQLEKTRLEQPLLLGLATALRLVAGPLLAFVLALALGLRGAAFEAGLVQAATPAAVIAAILAVEYRVAPAFVTSVVFLSTLLSPITLTLLIAALQH